MSTSVSKVHVEGRSLWCVEWTSSSRRAASFWYFERESEATVAHERLRSWDPDNEWVEAGPDAEEQDDGLGKN